MNFYPAIRTYCPIWMQLSTRYLKIIMSRNCALRENRRRMEGHTFYKVVDVTAFTRSATTSAVQPSRATE